MCEGSGMWMCDGVGGGEGRGGDDGMDLCGFIWNDIQKAPPYLPCPSVINLLWLHHLHKVLDGYPSPCA